MGTKKLGRGISTEEICSKDYRLGEAQTANAERNNESQTGITITETFSFIKILHQKHQKNLDHEHEKIWAVWKAEEQMANLKLLSLKKVVTKPFPLKYWMFLPRSPRW